MDSWSSWLWMLVGPIARKAAVALGFGGFTYLGVRETVEAAFGYMSGQFAGLVVEVFALLSRAGFFEALQISSGGLVSGLTFLVLKRWGWMGGGS